MKKLLLYLFFMSMFTVQASSNNHQAQKQDTTMRSFDINKYKDLPKNTFGYYILPDSTNVRIIEDNLDIQLDCMLNGYTYIYIYDAKDKKIRTKGTLFYTIEIGIWQYYSKIGILKKEENKDEGYLFSVDDLVKKMKEEHKEDLLNPDKVYSVARSYKLNPLKKTVYIVDCWQKGHIDRHYGDDFLINSYLIDATTGETIFTNVWLFYNEAAYGAFSAYLIHLGLERELDYTPKPRPNLPPPDFEGKK